MKLLFSTSLCFFVLLQPGKAQLQYPWVLLSQANESRDADMVRQDETQSRHMVGVINKQEPVLQERVVWHKTQIKDLLPLNAPFCEMHFDAVKPSQLTKEEKNILKEYFQRGGFILFFINAYPYSEAEFWKVKEWPLMNFVAKELPALDKDFTTGRATDDFPVFRVRYKTETAEAIKHELKGNANTPNRTLIYYKGRLCGFVMGRYTYLEDGQWAPMSKPFISDFNLDLRSYQLIVNIYVYSMLR